MCTGSSSTGAKPSNRKANGPLKLSTRHNAHCGKSQVSSCPPTAAWGSGVVEFGRRRESRVRRNRRAGVEDRWTKTVRTVGENKKGRPPVRRGRVLLGREGFV